MLNKILLNILIFFFWVSIKFRIKPGIACPQCATLSGVPDPANCIVPNPGIEPSVFLYDSCDVTVPDPDAGTVVVSSAITIAGAASFYEFVRFDTKQSSISGEKAVDASKDTWSFEMFIPANDADMHLFVKEITTNGYYGDCIITDKMGLQYIYKETEFAYTYTSNTTASDSGEPGWTVTGTTNIFPLLYTGVIP